jgi:hypothetical protein
MEDLMRLGTGFLIAMVVIICSYLAYVVIVLPTPQVGVLALTEQEVNEFHCLAKYHKLNKSRAVIYNYPSDPYFYYEGKKVNFKVKGVCKDE